MKLRLKISIIFTVIALFSTATMGFVFYRLTMHIQFEELRTTITALAASAAFLVDGDGHSGLRTAADMQSAACEEIARKLRAFQKNYPRIRKTVEGHPFPGSIRISVSIGVAEGSREASGKDEILKKAGEALYRAKEKGRNCVST